MGVNWSKTSQNGSGYKEIESSSETTESTGLVKNTANNKEDRPEFEGGFTNVNLARASFPVNYPNFNYDYDRERRQKVLEVEKNKTRERDEKITLMIESDKKEYERQQPNFDLVLRQINDFLGTPFHVFAKDKGFKKGKVEFNAYENPDFVIIFLKHQLKKLLDFKEKRKEAIEFIKNLLLKDRADDKTRPVIFSQNEIDSGKIKHPQNHDEELYYNPDVFKQYAEATVGDEWDTSKTYRTDYYTAILEMLSEFGPEGDSAIVECLKDIDSVVCVEIFSEIENRPNGWLKGKLGKDISLEDYERLLKLEKEGWDKINHKIVYSTSEAEEVAAINRDDFSFSYSHYDRVNEYLQTEYGLVKETIFKLLGQRSEVSAEVIDYLVGCIKNSHMDYRENFYDILKIINKNPGRAISGLLELIKKEKDPIDKALATRVVYHLEFGHVGISAEGVKYLERMYDLGEYNNPDFHVSRLTADGEVGIFDEELKLIKYFHLGDLSTDENKVRAQVLDVTYETLFVARPNETEEERKERMIYLKEFKANYHKLAEDKIFVETGVHLNNLSFREQGWFLIYFSTVDGVQKARIKRFLGVFGEEGLKTFLALELDRGMGEKILEMTENGDNNEVKKILGDYLKIVEYADNFYQAVAPHIKQASVNFNEKDFYLSLLSRANSLISFSAQYFKNNKAGSYTDILKDIESEDRGLSPESCMEAVVSKAIIEMVNAVGDVEARAVLDDVYQENQSAEIRKAIELAYSFITPVVTDAKAIRDLGDFYNKEIKFEEYKVNQAMNEAELAMMKGVVKKGDRVLDLGCGTGRLFVPLAESGVSAVGLDYSSRHVSLVREQNPSLVVTQGDWKNTGLQAKDFNVIYSLGRNILHEHQLPGQQKLFAETNRLLPIGGKFIFDIPDRSIGGYKKLCAEYARVMKQRGITKFREGTIYDSPDGKNFATRYAYSHEDVVQLAEDNGFEIERVEKKELATGQDDVNIYYTLKKVRESGEAKMSYSLAA